MSKKVASIGSSCRFLEDALILADGAAPVLADGAVDASLRESTAF